MNSYIVPQPNLRNISATRSGQIDTSNPMDPNLNVLRIENQFSQILASLQLDSNNSNNGENSSSNSLFGNSSPIDSILGNTSSASSNDLLSQYSINPLLNNNGTSNLITNPSSNSLQILSSLSEQSPLIGQFVQYIKTDKSSKSFTSKIKKVLINNSGMAQLSLENGELINTTQILGLAATESDLS